MAKEITENKGGRPTKFNKDIENFAMYLYREGKTDKEVAEAVCVNEATIHNWKKSHPKFFESLKEAKHYADDKVVASLYARANGYSHPEEKIFIRPSGGNKELYDSIKDLAQKLGMEAEELHQLINKSGHSELEDVIRADTIKHYPPDPTSCIFWLKNRKPKEWRDKQEMAHSGNVNLSFEKEDEDL